MRKLLTVNCVVSALMLVFSINTYAQTPQYIFPGGTSNNIFPFNTTSSNKVQWVFEPTDFTPAPSPGFITKVYFRTNVTSGPWNFADLRLSLGNVAFNTFPNATYVTGLNVVFGPQTITTGANAQGWFGFTLPTPWYYDGVSNFVIEATITNTTGITLPQSNVGGNKRIWGNRAATTGSTGSGHTPFGFDLFAGFPCTDTPKTSIAAPDKICPNREFTVRPDSFYSDADYLYEFSNNGTTWSNFTGTPGLYGEITDRITAAKWYRLTVTCKANPNLTWTTPPHKVSIAPFYYCYCEQEPIEDTGANLGNLTIINSNQLDTILAKGELATGTGLPVYGNFNAKETYTGYHDSLQWPCLYKDTNYIYHVSQIHSGNTFVKGVMQAYIDYNRDGQYNPNTERLFVRAFDGNGIPPQIIKVSATVPSNAQVGPTGLRVVLSEDTINGGPCGTYNGAGEVEDYIVEICYEPCKGQVNAGTVESTDSSMCTGYEYQLTDTLYDRKLSGFTRAWQVSGDNANWQNIPNSLNKDTLQRVFQGQPLYYRLRTVCTPTHDTNYSAATLVNDKPGYKCYCYSKATGGLNIDTSDIGGVTIADYNSNAGGPHLQNAKAINPRTDYTDIAPIEMFTDSTYEFRLYHTMPVREHGDAKITVFMDFNNNHEYDIPEERIFTGFTTIGNHTLIDNVVIPKNAITNVLTGMRVIVNNDVGPNIPSDQACGAYTSGETEDYLLIFRKAWPTSVAGIGESFASFNVTPNPASGKFMLNFASAADIRDIDVRITTVTGQLVHQEALEYTGNTLRKEMDMTTHPSGVYFVEINAGGQKYRQKLILK